jgi:phosphate starvation-inducible PhoH-like protein
MLLASLKNGSYLAYSKPSRKFVSPINKSKSKSNVLVRMGKSKNRSNKYLEYDDLDFSLDAARSPSSYGSSFDDSYMEKVFKPVVVKAKNPRQQIYLNELENEKTDIILAVGPAGTGKTMLPCHIGIRKLQSNEISKLVITRPAVSVEEQHGFLPGSLEEKMEPWLRPMMDVFQQYYSPMKIQKMIQQQIIEVSPLAYMRGRTFENAWIIADESQNMTPNQMLMLLTRIGNNSKMIITGDQKQHDRGFEKNGLTDFLNRLKSSDKEIPEIQIIEFLDEDVERHKVIPKILRLYQ